MYVGQIPIRTPASRAQRNAIVDLVNQAMRLQEELTDTKTPQSGTAIERQIDATDRQIDELVYELYGLTDKEIRIVEESVGAF